MVIFKLDNVIEFFNFFLVKRYYVRSILYLVNFEIYYFSKCFFSIFYAIGFL